MHAARQSEPQRHHDVTGIRFLHIHRAQQAARLAIAQAQQHAFAGQRPQRIEQVVHVEAHTEIADRGIGFQFLVAVYGGYFGAGIGILMLTALGFMGVGDIHRMNAVKTFLAVLINGASVIVFVRDGLVVWEYALAMAGAAILGGYTGARVARRLPGHYVRYAVIVIGFGLSAHYFIREYG